MVAMMYADGLVIVFPFAYQDGPLGEVIAIPCEFGDYFGLRLILKKTA